MRRKVLDALIAGKDISSAGLPASTQKYVTEELDVLGLVSSKTLSSMATDLARKAELI
jgi:hypothetical protein